MGNNNEFILELTGSLNQAKTQKQINADIRQLQKTISMLRITGTFAKGETKKELNQWVKDLGAKLNYVKLKGKIDSRNLKSEIDKSLQNMSFKDIDALNVDTGKAKLKLRKVMADMKAFASRNPVSVNVEMKKEKLNNDLTAFLNKHTKIQESGALVEESERIRELIGSVNDKDTLKEATEAFQLYKSEVCATGYATKSTSDKIKSMLSHITKIGSFIGAASVAVNNFKKSLHTLKSIDTLLTEISKANNMLSKNALEDIGNRSFEVASKYGKAAMDYLSGVQEAFRAGYENVEGIAELSVAAQGAGDMTAELANQMIIATDKAYKMNGSVSELAKVLDGMNHITSHNAVNMTQLSEAMSIVGSTAASFGVDVDETAAAVGTMIAATQQSGSEAARAFRAILLHIRQVSDEEEGIDAEGLTKYEEACNALNVRLKETKDGVVSLRDPMEVLKELSVAYNKLEESDIRRTNLLSAVGGKPRATQLDALLRRWDTYEAMIQQYADGTGSMAAEAEKTANSWEGSLHRMQNSFDSFVNTLTNKQAVIGSISFFDRLIQGAEKLVDAVGEIPVVLTALNSAMILTNKGGITQIWNKDKKKVDLQGSFFGINFTEIKSMKKHFSEAEGAIAKWNKELLKGNVDINDFGDAVFKNSAQLKEYLSTCSKDAPASLEGYKSHLKAAGIQTDALRLKTILLNSVITMIGGWAVQALITGFYKLLQVSDTVAQKAKELGDSFQSTKSDIEGYKSQITELHKTISDSNSSIEDVTNARKTLMSVQSELIDRFGTEKGVINDVTAAINGQADALDSLTDAKWQEAKNEFNDGGFWNDVSNFFDGKDNIERMLDEYGEQNISFIWAESADINKLTDEMVAELENIGIDIKVSTDNLQGTRDFDSLTESIKDTKGASLSITGNAEEIYNKLLALQNLIGNDDSLAGLYKSVEVTANSYKDLTDNYKEFYNQYVLYEKILTKGSGYADTFKDITDAYEEYKEAFASGNETRIKEATEKYAQILSEAVFAAGAKGDSDVVSYFESMYPELQSVVQSWKFNADFDTDTDGLQSKVQSALDGLKDEGGRSLTAEEILGLTTENEQYKALASLAHDYNMSLEEMVELLKERRLVSTMDYQGLTDLFGQENIDKLSPEDLEIAYTIKNTGSITFEQLQDEIRKIKASAGEPVPIPDITSSISQLSTQLEPQLAKLGEAYQAVFTSDGFTLDAVDNAMLEGLRKSFAEIGEEIGVAFDPAKLEPFFEVLTNGGNEDEVQRAFNGLATAYLYSTGTLEQLNDETANAVKIQLEQMGVTNAEEIVAEALRAKEEELALSKKYLALEGKELAEATDSEVLAFMAEQSEAGYCGDALALLQLKKLLVNGTVLDTQEDIHNVMSLAEAAGISTAALSEFILLKARLEKAEADLKSSENKGAVLKEMFGIMAEMAAAKKQFEEEVSSFEPNPVGVEFKSPDNDKSSTSSPAARQAETDWKNLLDKETDLLEKQLAANAITFQSYTDKRRRIIEDYYRDGKIKAEDYYDALESMYGSHLSLYDRVTGAVTGRIDEEIDRLREQKEETEKFYQVRIDAIQSEIDTLNKANDARREQTDLEKAQYEAVRAKNQRVSKVYDGGQFIYEADMDAVRSAEDDLADREFQLNISRLETQMDSLKAEMENAARSLDIQVEALEAYKDKWNEISGAYQKQQDRLLAAEIMGTEWERDILNGRLDTLRSFTEQYISLQQAQADAAVNAARIKAEAEAGNAAGGSVGSYDSGNNDNKQKYEVVYEGTAQTVREFKTQWEAQNYAKRMNKGIADDDFMYYVKNDGRKYASGTDSARRGLNLVGEDGTETFIDNDGNVSLVTRPTLIPMEGGEVVKSAEETKAMLDTGNLEPVQSDRMKELLAGIRNFKLSDVDLTKVMPPVSAMLNIPNMDYSHVLSHIGTEHNTVHIDNNNVSINCPNVTNNAGAEYIMKELKRLPLDTIQYIHRRQ